MSDTPMTDQTPLGKAKSIVERAAECADIEAADLDERIASYREACHANALAVCQALIKVETVWNSIRQLPHADDVARTLLADAMAEIDTVLQSPPPQRTTTPLGAMPWRYTVYPPNKDGEGRIVIRKPGRTIAVLSYAHDDPDGERMAGAMVDAINAHIGDRGAA